MEPKAAIERKGNRKHAPKARFTSQSIKTLFVIFQPAFRACTNSLTGTLAVFIPVIC